MALFIKPQRQQVFFGDPVDRYFVELTAGVIKGYFQSQSQQESRAENPGHSEEEIDPRVESTLCSLRVLLMLLVNIKGGVVPTLTV